jgi:hypothetical protein
VVCAVVGGGGNEPWVLRQSILVVVTTATADIHRPGFVEEWLISVTSKASFGSC